MAVETIHGAPSIGIACDTTRAWVTLRGAHVAPVTFASGGRTAEPYALAPWLPGEVEGVDPLLDILRGDFFCLPFGPQPDGPQHGEPSSGPWTVVDAAPESVTLRIDAADSGATVEKTVSVRPGQTALYQEFRVSGLDAEVPYGTHPVLDFSQQAPGGARLSTSPMRWCSVYPGVFSDPAAGETQVLQPGGVFDDLSAVPLAAGGTLDLSRYPTPPGHEDLVMLVNDPQAGRIGWSAAVLDGYVWFALKDIGSFPATLLWISNGGRTQPPWSGRFTGRMGIEDVCSYFAAGPVDSRAHHGEDGLVTVRAFRADEPVTMATVQGVAFAPPGFGRVAAIRTDEPGRITIVDEAGLTVTADVDWEWVK